MSHVSKDTEQEFPQRLPRFTRSTLPDPKSYFDCLIVIVETNGIRGVWISNGLAWVTVGAGGGSSVWGGISGNLSDQGDLNTALLGKQATLIGVVGAGQNLKSINGVSLLGTGDITISGGSAVWGVITGNITDQTDLNTALSGKQTTLVSGTSIKTINGVSVLGSGDLVVSGSGDMVLASSQVVTGLKTFGAAGNVGKLAVAGNTSGSTIIAATAVAGSTTVTLPAANDTLVGRATVDTLTNKTLTSPAINTPTVGGITVVDGAAVTTAAAVAALAIDTSKVLSTKTVSVDSTFTFVSSPATANTWFSVLVTNSDTNPHILTFPSFFSTVLGAARTTVPIPASGTLLMMFHWNGTNYRGFGDTPYLSNFANASNPAVTDDNTKGYGVGSLWGNTSSGALYWLEDATTGAAVWNAITGGGGGTGTVTNTGGNLTANSVVVGAGTVDTKVVAGIVTDGVSKITLGVAGTSVGALALNNGTSGSITIQPTTGALGSSVITVPAVTGTLLTTAAAVTVAQGGTGLASGTSGGIPYFSGGTTIASTAALAANALMVGGGAGVAPSTKGGLQTDGVSVCVLGVAGVSVGGVDLRNATSGTLSLRPVTGALGSNTLSLPAKTATIATTVQTDCMIGFNLPGAITNGTYTIVLQMEHAGTITSCTTQSGAGTGTATFKINTTALGGTANAVSTTKTSQAQASANTFAIGDLICVTISAASSLSDMAAVLKYTRTLA